jgi:O-antigen ligase
VPFLALNATLFLRPGEIIPALEPFGIYQILILVCLLVSAPQVLRRLTRRSLRADPVTLMVVGLLAAVELSHLSHLRVADAWICGIAFVKIVTYYLLLVATVDTPHRLRRFLIWLGVFTFALTVLALLQYHEVIDVPALAAYREQQDSVDPETGDPVMLARLCGAGIFGNPNDLSRILAIGIVISVYLIADSRAGGLRWVWVAPLLLFGYAEHLTSSRGGFLALLTSIAVLSVNRFGCRKTVLASAVVLPAMLFAFGGRQTELTTSSGTGQQRIHLWSEGFAMLKESPLFGIGMNEYAEEVQYVAHNSYLHCYTELGLVGGTLFTGAFYLAAVGLYRKCPEVGPVGGELERIRPYLLAIVAGYMVGMLSSTRSYSVPTYMLLGLGAAYAGARSGTAPAGADGLDARRLFRRVAAVSAVVLVALYLFLKLQLRAGRSW